MSVENIQKLLVKANVEESLATKIVESLQSFRENVEADANKTLQAKLAQAKQIVVQECEQYKLKLAEKVQLFCESKSQFIDQQLMRKSAAGETQAQNQLKQIRSITEGVDLETGRNEKTEAKLADAMKTVDEQKQIIVSLQEKNGKYRRISENAINSNKKLIQECKRLSNASVIKEEQDSITIPSKGLVNESVQSQKPISVPSKKSNNQVTVDMIDQIASSM